MTGTFLPPSRPEPSPQMLALKIRRDYRHQRLARSFTDASFAASARHPTTPRTPLAASPRPTRSRPRPVPPPIRAAPWLRSLALFGGGWQDLRAVHDSRGPCSEKGPFPARYSRGVSSNGGLRGFSDTWRTYLAKASSFRMHGVRILPGRGDFPARERTAAKSCHGKAPGNASRENLVTVERRGNAFRGHFAIGECPGTHQGTILPSPGAPSTRQ